MHHFLLERSPQEDLQPLRLGMPSVGTDHNRGGEAAGLASFLFRELRKSMFGASDLAATISGEPSPFTSPSERP
jgi:hypothetical protein